MNIKVIGCSGAEMPGYNAPGFLLNEKIMFDAGSLTNILDEKAQQKIRHIFITHSHLDHIISIPFLADNIAVGNMPFHKINIYGISSVIDAVRIHLFNSALWPDFTVIPEPENAILNLVKLKAGVTVDVEKYNITPFRVTHAVPAVGYFVEERGSGKTFFYSGDMGPSPGTWKAIGDRKIDCLIIDVSFPDSMHDTALITGHLTAGLLKAELAQMAHKPARICITHPKPQYVRTIKSEIEKLKMVNISILKRGDIINV